VDIVLLVLAILVGLIAGLAIGGAIANARRRRRTEAAFEASLQEVDRALAAAHAQDKGWEPEALEAAARRAFEAARPGVAAQRAVLVHVDDRPGTEHDRAIFRFTTPSGAVDLTLGRVDGSWTTDSVADAPPGSARD